MLSTKTLHPKYLTTTDGTSPFVVLPTCEYEDLRDLACITERENEETISHTDLISELKTDGLI
ncbi:MAG: hypothetical protein DRQ51_08650 [Gammaproteobacteria bacterium]|nr:MAG: hypothetical protein DRQ51_08650 [Gammaproteobacteria bacterium]